jgi:FMN phosphatase YigB (HAD superfamily)
MNPDRPVRAVLLDVDGTLYRQDLLRALMTLELATLPLVECSYRAAVKVRKILLTFRQVGEELRQCGSPPEPLEKLQYVRTAERIGGDPAAVEQTVSEWIFQRPLKYLQHCRRGGIDEFFLLLGSHNVPIGMFSDYPMVEKLHALGLTEKINLTLCATDSDINAFKPHPKGFLRACEKWGVVPDGVLYVGDRFEVDAVGAASAGMPCAIVSKKTRTLRRSNFHNTFIVSSFHELNHAFVKHFNR